MEKVCKIDDIVPETGVCALFKNKQVAIFRTRLNELFAVDNYDPFSHANVLSRGLLGGATLEDKDVRYIASPIYKQRFDLSTGVCLDDHDVKLNTYNVKLDGDDVCLYEQ